MDDWTKQRRRKYECVDCGGNPDCPMLLDSIWAGVAARSDFLCVSCVERRLDRRLTLADLKPCGLTRTILKMVERAQCTSTERLCNLERWT
jgi:hypothetical protein